MTMKKITFAIFAISTFAALPFNAFGSPQEQAPIITEEMAKELNSKLDRAQELVDPFIFLSDKKHEEPQTKKLKDAIALYDEVLLIVPDHWVSMFFKGKAYQALGDHPSAYNSFKLAFRQDVQNKDVLNEYAVEAMELGYFEEALSVLETGQTIYRSDIGVMGNYALALIMNNKLEIR